MYTRVHCLAEVLILRQLSYRPPNIWPKPNIVIHSFIRSFVSDNDVH